MFHFTIQLIIVLLLATIAVLIIRYLWLSIYEKNYPPVQWSYKLKNNLISKHIQKLEEQYPDKIQFYNFWFQMERIKRENIVGSFAELGVYQGDSARIIHAMNTNRSLFLFDTFNGFNKNDLQKETGEAATFTEKDFSDTSVDRVLERINGNENIKIKQGYFPETAAGLENETFAFVAIDADLYNPILEGLRFFYPRLASGGVIIIHDYSHRWMGAVKAINEFATTIPENIIEVPDMHGSVMIIKNKNSSPLLIKNF